MPAIEAKAGAALTPITIPGMAGSTVVATMTRGTPVAGLIGAGMTPGMIRGTHPGVVTTATPGPDLTIATTRMTTATMAVVTGVATTMAGIVETSPLATPLGHAARRATTTVTPPPMGEHSVRAMCPAGAMAEMEQTTPAPITPATSITVAVPPSAPLGPTPTTIGEITRPIGLPLGGITAQVTITTTTRREAPTARRRAPLRRLVLQRQRRQRQRAIMAPVVAVANHPGDFPLSV